MKFDRPYDHSKSPAWPSSRRQLLALLGGLVLGGGPFGLGKSVEAEQRKRKKRRQRRNKQQNRRAIADRCQEILLTASCTYGRVGLIDAWTCAPGTSLDYQDLSGCRLEGSILRHVTMNEADLSKAVLNNADLEGAQLWRANFERAAMVQARAVNANLGGVSAYRADLRWTDFGGATLNSADLTSADTRNAIFQNADLRGVQWTHAPWVTKPDLDVLTSCPDGAKLLWPNDCCGHLNGYTTPMC